jgi:hypothetical protein
LRTAILDPVVVLVLVLDQSAIVDAVSP